MSVYVVDRLTMHRQHAQHRPAVFFKAAVRAETARHLRGGEIRLPCHQCSDGSGEGTACVGVVGDAFGHQQRAEVGISQAELAESPCGLAYRFGGIVGTAHKYLLSADEHLHGRTETGHIKALLVIVEREQIEAGEVAGRVVKMKIFAAGVAGIYRACVGGGVPAVDGAGELHAGIGALPRCRGDLAKQLFGRQGSDDFACGAGGELPVGAFQQRAHELV